jgi:hypothetical protein
MSTINIKVFIKHRMRLYGVVVSLDIIGMETMVRTSAVVA